MKSKIISCSDEIYTLLMCKLLFLNIIADKVSIGITIFGAQSSDNSNSSESSDGLLDLVPLSSPSAKTIRLIIHNNPIQSVILFKQGVK